MIITPSLVIKAIKSSIRKRAFSKRQTPVQKLSLFSITLLVFLLTRSFLGFVSIPITILVLVIMRWVHLDVMDVKEGVTFFFATLYTALLFLLSKVYKLCYEGFLKKFRRIDFFPEFPFNKQTFTDGLTKKEANFRDEFWGPRISENSPSPNLLTVIRIVGSIILIVFHNFTVLNFSILAFMLFLTDYFDGIIARTQNRETLFGKWADPLADRLLLLAAVIFIYSRSPAFWGLNISKFIMPEALLLLLGLVIVIGGRSVIPRPLFWGRLKFTLYFLGVFSLLTKNGFLTNWLLTMGLIFSYVAIVSYATRAYQEIAKESIYCGVLRFFVKCSDRIRQELYESGSASK